MSVACPPTKTVIYVQIFITGGLIKKRNTLTEQKFLRKRFKTRIKESQKCKKNPTSSGKWGHLEWRFASLIMQRHVPTNHPDNFDFLFFLLSLFFSFLFFFIFFSLFFHLIGFPPRISYWDRREIF